METSTLTSKGQLLIPKRIRNRYGIKAGVKVILEETDKGVLITPMNKQYFQSFAGILKKNGNLKEEMKKIKAEEKELEDRKLFLKTRKK